VNAALGVKRVCPECEAKFYDLNKRPVVCPKCGHSFDPDKPVKKAKKETEKKETEKKAVTEEKEAVKLAAKDDEDIDLSTYEVEVEEGESSKGAIEEIEDIEDEEDIDNLSELDDREVVESSSGDDADEDALMGGFAKKESLVDELDEDEEEEDED
jgi:uncharacterized protein (TIGR02300 family)